MMDCLQALFSINLYGEERIHALHAQINEIGRAPSELQSPCFFTFFTLLSSWFTCFFTFLLDCFGVSVLDSFGVAEMFKTSCSSIILGVTGVRFTFLFNCSTIILGVRYTFLYNCSL
uniref:Uncharacterized protein n=1 Tax=Cacopsylla melanoneura TaxID=428564 RepID=A0A8D8YFC4_9HEMI